MSSFYPLLEQTIKSLNPSGINAARKEVLQPLIEYMRLKHDAHAPMRLHFICTQNARRSHLAQIWAQTLASYYQLKSITCYSGGTEASAMYPAVGHTLAAQGFEITMLTLGQNPIYALKFGRNELPILGFSKTFADAYNPQSNFAAVMVCEHAAQNCPFVSGAETRISIPYDDPKIFDETALESEKYLETSTEIATEMAYIISTVVG